MTPEQIAETIVREHLSPWFGHGAIKEAIAREITIERARLDYLIEHGDWHKPGTRFDGSHYQGEWTSHDGRGCDDAITPQSDDPREALDLAIKAGWDGTFGPATR